MTEILGVDSRWLYTGLVALVALQRGVELLLARRNVRRLLERGGIEVGRGHYPWMVALHAGFLLACPAEVWLLERPLQPAVAVLALAVLAAAALLRWRVIATLGERWTTRIICLPGQALVAAGPYRYLRHPNYVAVAAEIVALPLVHGAWVTALAFSLANAWLLAVRIRSEEEGLARISSRRAGSAAPEAVTR